MMMEKKMQPSTTISNSNNNNCNYNWHRFSLSHLSVFPVGPKNCKRKNTEIAVGNFQTLCEVGAANKRSEK